MEFAGIPFSSVVRAVASFSIDASTSASNVGTRERLVLTAMVAQKAATQLT